MPDTLKNKITAIDAEVLRLHYKWKYLKQLFGSDERAELLNKTAPLFFGYLWNSMLFDILLSIARLTDPAKTKAKSIEKENLSFDNLLAEVKDVRLHREITCDIRHLKGKVEAVKTWRNEKLAHNDLSRQMAGAPLSAIQVSEITDALDTIRKVMNIFHRQFNSQTVWYEGCFDSEPGDGKSLLYHLKYGFDAAKEDYDKSDVSRSREIIAWLKD